MPKPVDAHPAVHAHSWVEQDTHIAGKDIPQESSLAIEGYETK